MSEKIICEICNASTHAIVLHLREAHGVESSEPCTIEEYSSRFPDAPLASEYAKKRIAEKKAKRLKEEAPKQVEKLGAKEPIRKLFGLGNIKAAKNKKGGDVFAEVCQQTGYEELIPERDANYIYNVDVLKSLLMGIQSNIPTYIYGHAGVGKSTIFEQICSATKRRMVRVQHTVNTEESHILGQWIVKKHKDEGSGQVVPETIFELGPLPLAMLNGWVYMADEYDRAYPSVLSCYQAVLEGKSLYIKEADEANRLIKPHPDFRFVATGNTNGAGDETGLYQATVVQDAATFERFGVVQKMDYMLEKQERAVICAQTNLVEDDAKRIVNFCHRVRESYPNTISLTIGPRVAINIARIGLMRGSFRDGVELSFANRLPESEREAALSIAQRIFG